MARRCIDVAFVLCLLRPDVHLGKGATIGSVFASRDYVCPNAATWCEYRKRPRSLKSKRIIQYYIYVDLMIGDTCIIMELHSYIEVTS